MPDFDRAKRPHGVGLQLFALNCALTFAAETFLIHCGGVPLLKWMGYTNVRSHNFRLYLVNVLVFIRAARQAYWALVVATWHMEVKMSFIIQSFNLLSDSLGILGAMLIENDRGQWMWIGTIVFLFGSFLESFSEFERMRFKNDPSNKGQAYTGGLFALSVHINYFGYALWRYAYAIVGYAAPFSLCLVCVVTGMVIDFYRTAMPGKEQHCAARYGAAYAQYVASTRRFVPIF